MTPLGPLQLLLLLSECNWRHIDRQLGTSCTSIKSCTPSTHPPPRLTTRPLTLGLVACAHHLMVEMRSSPLPACLPTPQLHNRLTLRFSKYLRIIAKQSQFVGLVDFAFHVHPSQSSQSSQSDVQSIPIVFSHTLRLIPLLLMLGLSIHVDGCGFSPAGCSSAQAE